MPLKHKSFKSRGAPAQQRGGTRWWGGATYQTWHTGYYLFESGFSLYHHDTVSVTDTPIEVDNYARLNGDLLSAIDNGLRSVNFSRAEASVTASVSDSLSSTFTINRTYAEDVFADDGLE